MGADGSGLTQLTTDSGDDSPSWSPDGTAMTFERSVKGGGDIYLMGSDGSQLVRLTRDGAGNAAWSPDGTRIAFDREAAGNADIYLMDVDGSNVTRLTRDALLEYSPAWSPDGSMLAFVAYSAGPPPSPVHLYVMNVDGNSSIRRIGPSDVAYPSWSPDGSEIAFVDETAGSIFTIRPDGTGIRKVIDVPSLFPDLGFYPPNFTSRPAWSPDGKQLAFAAGSPSSSYVFVANADGSDLFQLTHGSVHDEDPSWGPA